MAAKELIHNRRYGFLLRKISGGVYDQQRSDAWFKDRKGIIGGSEVYRAYGGASYFIRQKVEDNKINLNHYMHWGTIFEKVAADLYSRETDTQLFEMPLLKHFDYEDDIGASVDRLVWDPKRNYYYLLEIKCPSRKNPEDVLKDKSYWMQMQQQMACSGMVETVLLAMKFVKFWGKKDFLEDKELKFGITKGALWDRGLGQEPVYPPEWFEEKDLWIKWLDEFKGNREGMMIYWKLADKAEKTFSYDSDWYENDILPRLLETNKKIKYYQENQEEYDSLLAGVPAKIGGIDIGNLGESLDNLKISNEGENPPEKD